MPGHRLLRLVAATAVVLGSAASAVARPVVAHPRRVPLERLHPQPGAPSRVEAEDDGSLPLVPDPAELRAQKAAAGRRQAALAGRRLARTRLLGPPDARDLAPGDARIVANGVGIAAAGGFSPADATGAIGPGHYVEVVNGRIAVFRRADLGLVSQAVANAFTGNPSRFLVDPQVQWDQGSGRWYAAWSLVDDQTDPAQQHDYLVVAWSRTADPSDLSASGWCSFRFTTDVGLRYFFDDYPKLGDSGEFLVLGTNAFEHDAADRKQYGGGVRPFRTARIWALPKPPVGSTACTPPAATELGPDPTAGTLLRGDGSVRAVTPVPANLTDGSVNGYVVAANQSAPRDHLTTWRVSAASPGVPQLTLTGYLGVPAYSTPADVLQPGTPNRLETNDTRLTQAVARRDPDVNAGAAESVWTQHTVVDPATGLAQVRWYEIVPATGSVRQTGSVADPTESIFDGAISPAADGAGAGLVYNRGGGDLLAELRVRLRRGGAEGTPLGALDADGLVGSSADFDGDYTCVAPASSPGSPPVCRWGDYAAATPDESRAGIVWGTGQLLGARTGTAPSWVTRNVAAGDVLPTAAFAGRSPVRVGDAVTFDARGSVDPDGSIARYRWDLDGDGSLETDTGAAPAVSHVYRAPGATNVTLQVTDDGGQTGAVVHPIAVVAKAKLALRLAVDRHQSVRTLVRSGLRVRVSCGEPCRVGLRLVLDSRTARRLKLTRGRRSVALGARAVRLGSARTGRATVRLTRRAPRRLRRVRRIKLALGASAVDGARHRAKRSVVVRLRR